MKELQIIDQREVLGKPFTLYGDLENPLFLAKEVAEWIQHSDVSTMLRTVDDSEKGTNIVCTLGGKQDAWFLTEYGLYEVLMQSRKPIAKQFKQKVKEILRSIRKHGAYITPPTLESMISDPDTMIAILTALKEEQKKVRALDDEVETLEIALNDSLQYFTVAKYNKTFLGGAWDIKECSCIGKQLAAYCRARAIEIRKCSTNDERFGEVNSYPITVWNEFMEKLS